MTAARKLELITPGEYLAREFESPIRHEYFGGCVYAKAGARNQHNTIGTNILGSLYTKLRGKPCRPCGPDTKIRILRKVDWRFYYLDVSVVCEPNPPEDAYQDRPVVVVEVLSKRSMRDDLGEKRIAYLKIPTLKAYIVVQQDIPEVVVFRRDRFDYDTETYDSLDGVIPLPEIGTELPLAEIYESVEFSPEPDGSEDI